MKSLSKHFGSAATKSPARRGDGSVRPQVRNQLESSAAYK